MARKVRAPRLTWKAVPAEHQFPEGVCPVQFATGPRFCRLVAVGYDAKRRPRAFRYATAAGHVVEWNGTGTARVVREREEGGEGGVHHADTLRTAGVARGVSR